MFRIIKSIALFLIIACISCNDTTKNQAKECNYLTEYYQTVYEAELAFWEKDYGKSYALFKKAESNCELLNQLMIREPEKIAILSVILGKDKGAFPYLERLLKEGISFDSFENNEYLATLKKYPEWDKLKSKEIDYLLAYREGLNQELRNEIIAINIQDQKYRSPPYDDEKMEHIDSLNNQRIKEIFKEYGYPHYGLIGRPRPGENTDIMVMLMHFFDSDYYTPLLLESTSNGIAPPGYVGFLVDREKLGSGEKYVYGIYDNADESEIADFENLDKRRIAIGLPPWETRRKVRELKETYYESQ